MRTTPTSPEAEKGTMNMQQAGNAISRIVAEMEKSFREQEIKSCPKCGARVPAWGLKKYGYCMDCYERRENALETIRSVYENGNCGLCAEDRNFTFDRLTPGYQAEIIVSRLRQWTVEKANGKGEFIAGDLGTGKTTLVKCLIRQHVYNTHKSAIFMNFPKLFFDLRKGGFNNPVRDLLDRARTVSLLVIDDVGIGAKPSKSEDELLPLIDERWVNRRPTFFTCNMALPLDSRPPGMAELGKEHLTTRMIDRIMQATGYMQFIMSGHSLRGRI
jgi:DNA replication protein DnaC